MSELSHHHRATAEKVLHRPRDKDVDEQMIVNLRRLLVQAGYGEPAAVEDSRDRNYGDNRWGKPE